MDAGQTWSDDIESVLDSLRFNAAHMSEFHKEKYLAAKAKLMFFKIPIIVISGANSVIAVGLGLYVDQRVISATNCLLALTCGILGSVELFMGIQSSMELELSVSKQFYLLSIDIYKTLAINRHQRHISGKFYIEQKFQEYARIFATANVISDNLPDSMTVKNSALSLGNLTDIEHIVQHRADSAADNFERSIETSMTRRRSSNPSQLSISIPEDPLAEFKKDLRLPDYAPTVPMVPRNNNNARRSIKNVFALPTPSIDPKRLEEEEEEARIAAEEEANRV